MVYALALFDKSENNKWDILRKKFVIEESGDSSINGIYLSDLWLNKEIGKGDYENSIHFMVIETINNKKYVLDDLNRLVDSNHKPSSKDMPENTSSKAFYFCLDRSELNKITKSMIKKQIEHKIITLYSQYLKSEIKFSINFMKSYNILTISLPRFKIY